MKIPFSKLHGAGNDFLFTWERDAPGDLLERVARDICDRHTGVGGDGWYVVDTSVEDCDAAIRLFNSDGSPAELSGNGTRCAAALLTDAGLAGDELSIRTGAGVKRLRLLDRQGPCFTFEMEMGAPRYRDDEVRCTLPVAGSDLEVTILDVGNPQCAVFVREFPPGWSAIAAALEGHPRFPNRTNVSFVRAVDEHAVEARFFERGAGETRSSGTGSVGAAAASVLRGLTRSPVRVDTPAGPLDVRWDDGVFLTGPAEIVAQGHYHWRSSS